MIRRRFRLVGFVMVAVAAVLSTGCTTKFILDEARTSTVSFLTGVLSTAVDEAIKPSP